MKNMGKQEKISKESVIFLLNEQIGLLLEDIEKEEGKIDKQYAIMGMYAIQQIGEIKEKVIHLREKADVLEME